MHSTRLIKVIVLSLLASLVSAVAETAEDDARKAAEQWLALLDSGKYLAAWTATAPYFQRLVPKDDWEMKGKRIRESFGRMISRKLKSAQYTKSAPGAPDGEYVILQFDTSFENKKSAVETITPMKDKDGKWKVSGYFIK